ncbi:Zn-ribbon domain-containing OB-fold protein [Hydrogenophaga sp.]|uniref:Zn-ribbon domain-containing OB-fold protein n=1 Tax=Hydrogenophaga sp. TaxID=1904254 RepID=UPI002614543F|nr:Zn-ribbon domain-containing OB-fold protein [Hydrogenophaga sp.]MCW5652748.1 Zn-ribbon domain-containing OB-fold protein [Hydrogenophaga sp.]
MTDTTHLQDPFVEAFPENAPFWAAAERGELLLRHCEDCGRPHWFARVVCPLCGSDRLAWKTASGRGEIHSFSVVRRAGDPYVLAYVRLDEGPTVMTNIVDTPFESLRIGQRVHAVFRAVPEGRSMPFYVADGA